MSQFDFGTIDPTTKNGTVLSSDLNAFRTALNSCHSGSSRPDYAIAKTVWVNDATIPWVVYMFDGTDDIQIGTINATTNVFTATNAVQQSSATGSAVLPSGTTAQRDGTPSFGYTRANSTTNQTEWWNGTAWTPMGGGATGAGTDTVFHENDAVVSQDYTIGGASYISGVTVTIASPAVFTLTSHGFVEDSKIHFATTGALPTGLTVNTVYYVISTGLTSSSFQVSLTAGGTAVNTSGTQSGVHSVGKIKNAVSGGEITVATGKTVTVPTGSTWSIV